MTLAGRAGSIPALGTSCRPVPPRLPRGRCPRRAPALSRRGGRRKRGRAARTSAGPSRSRRAPPSRTVPTRVRLISSASVSPLSGDYSGPAFGSATRPEARAAEPGQGSPAAHGGARRVGGSGEMHERSAHGDLRMPDTARGPGAVFSPVRRARRRAGAAGPASARSAVPSAAGFGGPRGRGRAPTTSPSSVESRTAARAGAAGPGRPGCRAAGGAAPRAGAAGPRGASR